MLHPLIQAVSWKNGICELLDQTRLPGEEVVLGCKDYREVVNAISRLAVRGAPAIGIAGAYAFLLALKEALTLPSERRVSFFKGATAEIAAARPTAVNLKWAVERMSARHADLKLSFSEDAWHELEKQAIAIHMADIDGNRKMAELGAALLASGKAVLTICNTGDLATGGIGTAFGVFREGYRQGKVTKVFSCETRPVMQGLRLTAWELQKNQIPFALICDSMAGIVMRSKEVGAVIVGADRIAANGDAANKVGTYTLAVLARHHGIPFYVAAPTSTFDLKCKTGDDIPIEQRSEAEILGALGSNQPKEKIPMWNPSFDVTPAELITAIICEKTVFEFPAKNGGVKWPRN